MSEIYRCAHCQKPIINGEAYVTCPVCEKIYHENCWTTCNCLETCVVYEQWEQNKEIKYVETSSAVQNIISQNNDEINDTDYDCNEERYVGSNYKYYKNAFAKLRNENSNKFNFAAFFFSIPWLFYRKMFLPGFITIGLTYLVSFTIQLFLTEFLSPNIGLSISDHYRQLRSLESALELANSVITILIALVIGFIGNKLYLHKIETLKDENKPYRCGGTNIIYAILIPIGITILEAMILAQL